VSKLGFTVAIKEIGIGLGGQVKGISSACWSKSTGDGVERE
jgi:hypothetical protein